MTPRANLTALPQDFADSHRSHCTLTLPPGDCRRLYQQLVQLASGGRVRVTASSSSAVTAIAAPTAATVLDLALDLLDQGDFQTRWQVAKLIPALGKMAIAPLVHRLASIGWADDDEADWDLPWFIVRILGEMQDPAAGVALINLLQTTPDADVASMAALALGKLGVIVLPRLAELLRSPSTRRYAVQTLAHLQTPAAINLLLSVTADPDPAIRMMAIDALSRLPVPNLAEIIIPALADPDPQVQRVAVIAAGLQASQLPEAPLVTALQTHLLTGEPAVAQEAAIALGRLGTPAAVEVLTAGLFQPLPLARSLTIVRELARIASEPALAALETYVLDTSSATVGLPPLDRIAVSQEIARLLGQVETAAAKAQAAAILLRLLTTTNYPAGQPSYDQEILPVIALSLAHLGHTPAIAPLQQHLAHASDRCRLHLLTALKQLDRAKLYTPAD